MPSKNSKYVGDCTVKGVTNQFKDLKYMTNIKHSISTGNKMADKAIAEFGGKILDIVTYDPKVKVGVKIAKAVYPHVEKGGANVARGVVTYNKTCKRKK